MEQHSDKCLMLERWATLEEHLKNMENTKASEFKMIEANRLIESNSIYEKLSSYVTSQSLINAEHTKMLTELWKYVYEDGLNTRLDRNKRLAATETAAVRAEVDMFVKLFKSRTNWIWLGIGAVLLMLIGIYFK